MISDNHPPKRYYYGPYEGYELRSQHRIHDGLGVDETATEIILRLRSQIIELQSQIRQLESELTSMDANQQLRLAHYRDVFFEATWIELEFSE